MYVLSITKKRYPKNDTLFLEYEKIDNLLNELKKMINNNKIKNDDIIRIEKEKD